MSERQDDRANQTAPRGSDSRRASAREQPGQQKGPQDHGEGEHGPKTRARLIEQLESGPPEAPVEERVERKRRAAAYRGKRRLVEDRTQHDEAEKNSERARLFDQYRAGDTEGPEDNRGKLHGPIGYREHRADYKLRGPDGLRAKE